jgi:hypothetical protein
MNVLKSILLGGCVAALTLCASTNLMAQGRGFDPTRMRQERIDRAKDLFEIKDDTEWKAIEPLVAKVVDAQFDSLRMRAGMFGRGGRGGRPRNNDGGGDTNTNNGDQPQRRNRGGFGEPDAAVTALQKAVEDKAPAAELKEKLAAVRAERKEREAKLQGAQDELKGVLTSRQEAIAVANGYLD